MLFREVAENLMNRLGFVYVVGQSGCDPIQNLCVTRVSSVSQWLTELLS